MKKLARFFRKLADFVDPNCGSQEEITISVKVDSEEAERMIDALLAKTTMFRDTYAALRNEAMKRPEF